MENNNGRETRSRRAKKQEKQNQANVPQECDSSNMCVREHKMDVGNIEVKEETKKADGRKGTKKTKIRIVMEPQAGPSGLNQSDNTTIVEKTDFMVICKYKLPPKLNLKPTKPYEVMWGQNFLNTLCPNYKKKGILKKPYIDYKRKSRLRFSQTTVYYFERAEPHSTIPLEGDISVNMEQHHFYSNLLSVDTYEAQKEIRQKRNLAASNNADDDEETRQLILPVQNKERSIILHTIQVPVELLDENDKNSNIVQHVKKGCSCNLYCDPDICECNLNGKQCEIVKDNYPCGCKLDYCRNTNGREAFNDGYTQKNVVTVANSGKPAPKNKEIKSGRVNKRKQFVPTRYNKL